MYGDEGGLIEFRSSLLATHGFAALSLPYFDFEDLPRVMKELKLEYFEEAARFLQRHPKVSVMRDLLGLGRIQQLCLSGGGDFFFFIFEYQFLLGTFRPSSGLCM